MNTPFENLSDILSDHAARRPDRLAFNYIGKPAGSIGQLTFSALSDRVDALACHLLLEARVPVGGRAVLLYPQCLDFIVAFMACLRAGIVAVPLSLPINRQDQARLLSVIEDSAPDAILTLGSIGRMPECLMLAQFRPQLPWVFTDESTGQAVSELLQALPHRGPDDIAFLQYTSGSTGMPKGVIVTHGNIMSNQAMISRGFGATDQDVGLTWLPLYHDMGLIGTVMQTIYMGAFTHMMSPLEFLQRPLSWLEAISEHRVTMSGGPNFAFALCNKRIDAEAVARLDLRSWRVAPNGAEPVRHATLHAFAEKFRPAGFDARAYFPCYGLAEATLLVSGGPAFQPHRHVSVDPRALANHQVEPQSAGYSLVSSGRIAPELKVEIVNAETFRPVPQGGVGEIWVAGPSIAQGYWKKEAATVDTFQAQLADRPGHWMRTGDLGFVSPDGELFITGRLKDLIIIGGKNLYPQDLESLAEHAHPSLRIGSSAAFVADEDSGGIVLVVELRKDALPCHDLEPIKSAVRAAVSEQAAVRVTHVTVTAPGKVLKTTSGKIRRSDCRKEWLAGHLKDMPVVSVDAPESGRSETV